MDIKERIEIDELFKYYGQMLTDKQIQVINMYVDNNLSLLEVAQELKVTRQAVKDALDKATKTLKNLEAKLGFIKRDKNLLNKVKINKQLDEKSKKLVEKIIREG